MSDDRSELSEPSGDASSQAGQGVPFSVFQQFEFTRKELRETLRDRRTIVTLLVMPLLLYPLLGLALRAVAFHQSAEKKVEYQLAIETAAEAQWLLEIVQLGNRALESAGPPGPEPDVQVFVPEDTTDFDLASLVAESAADLGVRVELLGDSNTGPSPDARVELFVNEGSAVSRDASHYFQQRLSAANAEWIKNWADRNGESLPVLLEQTRTLVSPAETGSAVLGLIPLILLLMTVTGGVYPAIDLTAGERERNTMETLMALPVPRSRLLAAKYVAVMTVTMMTGCMNLLAMSATLYAMQLDTVLLGDDGFTVVLGAKLFLALAAFALFYSAVLLLLTSSARSFKEAQAYLIPLLLLSIAPGMVIIMPGWELNRATAAIPLVNILLLSKELLEGAVQQLPAVVTVVTTILYGISALSLASKVFGNDAVAVGSRGRWKDLLRRPHSSSLLPSLQSTLCTLAVLFPCYFIASGVLSRGELGPAVRLALSAVLTATLFVVVPWLSLHWQRVSPEGGFGLVRAKWPYWIAAPLLGLSTWPWIFESVMLAQSLGLRGIAPDQIENVESLLSGWRELPLWLVVVCLGVVPGVSEELFFRGYLFNGMKQHLDGKGTVILSAVAFGLFHFVLAGGAAPERILPSTMMGLLLGWVAWRSGSTIPSIILHAVHNSTLLTVVQSRDTLARWNIGQIEEGHLPWWCLAISLSVLAAGAAIVHFVNTRRPTSVAGGDVR